MLCLRDDDRMILRMLQEKGQLCAAELCMQAQMSPHGAVDAIHRLLSAGLVRQVGKTEHNARIVTISDLGREQIAQA